MYPFNASPGSRSAASVFGAVGEAGFDDRDGQFLVRFDTTGIAAPGLAAANYSIASLQLSLTVNVDNSFRYDPTYDSFQTYLNVGAPNYVADSDPGRPVELFAVGYRNGYTEATFHPENPDVSPFSPGNPMTEGVRNAYAAQFNAGGSLIDVSNNVAGAFEAAPLAVGQIAGLAPGSLVPGDSLMTFHVDLTNPFVVAWLQASLNAGYLEFMVSSLQPTSQEASSGFPSFYTKENLLNDPGDPDFLLAAQLSGDVAAVPEPETAALLAFAGAGAMFITRRRRRHA